MKYSSYSCNVLLSVLPGPAVLAVGLNGLWVVSCHLKIMRMRENIFPCVFTVNFYLHISTSVGNSSGEAGIVSVLDSVSCYFDTRALWFTWAFCCFSRWVKPPFLCLVFGDHISLPWCLDCGWMREARVLQENWWVFGDTDRLQDCCYVGCLHWQFRPETPP